MRQKIQRSMVIVIAITLGITYVLLTAIIYSRTVRGSRLHLQGSRNIRAGVSETVGSGTGEYPDYLGG